jgi:hypothetical protein
MRSIIIAILIALGLTSSATAAPKKVSPPACVKISALMERLKSMVEEDGKSELQVYTGERAAKIRDLINSLPPETHFKADQIVTVIHRGDEGEGSVITIFSNGGCVAQVFPAVPLKAHLKMLEKALGSES